MANMTAMAASAQGRLQAAFAQYENVCATARLLEWDTRVHVAEGSRARRVRHDQIAELQVAAHIGIRDPKIPGLLADVRAEANVEVARRQAIVDTHQRRAKVVSAAGGGKQEPAVAARVGERLAGIREMERLATAARAVDPGLTRRIRLASWEAKVAWHRCVASRRTRSSGSIARGDDGDAALWATFAVPAGQLLNLAKERSRQIALAHDVNAASSSVTVGERTFNAVVEESEPYVKSALVDKVATDLESWLPQAAHHHQQRHHAPAMATARGVRAAPSTTNNDPRRQMAAVKSRILATLGVDLSRVHLVHTEHGPGQYYLSPHDCRLNLPVDVSNPMVAIVAALRFAGAARYVTASPPKHHGQPIGYPRSCGLVEAQRLIALHHIGGTAAFAKYLATDTTSWASSSSSPSSPSFGFDSVDGGMALWKAMRCPSAAAHVETGEVGGALTRLLRHRLVQRLVESGSDLERVPELWRDVCGACHVDTRDTASLFGPMMESVWTEGQLGATTSELLSIIYAAQIHEAMSTELRAVHEAEKRRDSDDGSGGSDEETLDTFVERGDQLASIRWLRSRIGVRASELPTPVLLLAGTGKAIDDAAFRTHLLKRYF